MLEFLSFFLIMEGEIVGDGAGGGCGGRLLPAESAVRSSFVRHLAADGFLPL